MKRNDKMKIVILILLMLAHLSVSDSCAEDPKAAARAMGDAGRSAAAAVARDPASASGVPGYAGTNRPERDLGVADLEDAAARALADPGDPGGRAGRAVIEGTTARPGASVAERRIRYQGAPREIQGDPGASRFGRLGPGVGVGISDCASGLDQAESGGACGGVRWCAGADCGTTSSQANTGFVGAAAKAQHGARTRRRGIRPREPALLPGRAARVPDPLGRAGELLQELGPSHRSGKLHRGRAPPGAGAPRREDALPRYALRQADIRGLYPTETCLVRLRLQARPHPSGSGAGAARDRLGQLPGFTVSEMERIDFEAVDLSEFTSNLMDGASEPSIALPDSGDTGSLMRERIRDFYTRNQ